MGDEVDPCECLWNHEMAMRRLISLLRQGQSYCTDSECLEQLPGLPAPQSAGNSFLVMFLMMALAVAMYMMRPRRNQIQDVAKPDRNTQDRDGAPPTPPRI
ncbi:small integral membrane protein 14 [Plodia interpunctella]|uniref:small integral membrane protein 14 n=1 Tax=Plodia interpunctella TaxID=58824 RepID=UPI00236885CD|nr:small integral membrane protein 14 [Plodia interpunctella]XP_053625139.1 small integral membrane protein 14 [Plodia interpunctella]